MGIADQDITSFRDWEIKIKDLKEKMMELESRELKDVMIYYSIMQNACMQFGGLVAISSIMTSVFKELKFFLVVGMVLAFFLCIVYPFYFGNKRMQALKCSTLEVIGERKRLYKSCISLGTKYNNMCAVGSPFTDTQVLLLREIVDVEMKFFMNFQNENVDLAYQTKYYPKFLLLMGIVGLIYAVAFTSAFYVYFQDVPKASRRVPVKRQHSFHCCCHSFHCFC